MSEPARIPTKDDFYALLVHVLVEREAKKRRKRKLKKGKKLKKEVNEKEALTAWVTRES